VPVPACDAPDELQVRCDEEVSRTAVTALRGSEEPAVSLDLSTGPVDPQPVASLRASARMLAPGASGHIGSRSVRRVGLLL